MDDEKDFNILYRGDVPQGHNFVERIITQSRAINPKRDRTFVQNFTSLFIAIINNTYNHLTLAFSKNPSIAIVVMAVLAITIGLTMDTGFDFGTRNQSVMFDMTDVILYDMMTL